MKIDINTPQDQLLKYQKSCGTAFGWLLGIGIVTFPVGIVPIGFALYFHSRKKKAAALIAQQQFAPKITPVAGFGIAERYAAERQAALASWDKFLEENVVVREIHTKVAGVTFRNEDGSSRQKILADICPGEAVAFEHFTYQGAPAYSVSCCGRQIGNLPADLARDLYELPDDYTFVGEVHQITGGYDGLAYGCNLLLTLYRHK